jgi:hypothetical protein
VAERTYTAEEKAEAQEIMLDLYSRRYKIHEILRQMWVNHGSDVGEVTLQAWLKEAIRKQELPDPAFALRRDLLLVDSAIAALIPKVMDGVPSAHLALSRWMDRRAKWLGLDAPEKIEAIIRNVHTGPIDEEIRELTERLGFNQPPKELPSS